MVHTTEVQVPTSGGAMPATVLSPGAEPAAGIVVCQEIFGVTGYIRRWAQRLAEAGYAVLTPEFYWRLPQPGPVEGAGALEQGVELMQQFDWELGVADGAAAVRWLRAELGTGGRVGLVGFCFGGGLAFNIAALEPVQTLVSFYGSALPGLVALAPRVRCAQQHHWGLADAYVDADTVARIERAVAGPDTEFWTYPGADHAFDNEDFVNADPGASALARERTGTFLARTLPAT